MWGVFFSPVLVGTTAMLFLLRMMSTTAQVSSHMAHHRRNPGEWDFVRRIQLNVSDVDKCQTLCDLDNICSGWSLVKSPVVLPGVANTTDPLALVQLDCYLLSQDMLKISDTVPSVRNHGPTISGQKSGGPAKHKSMLKKNNQLGDHTQHLEPPNVQFQSLFAGPIATDTSTLLNFPQHFVSQCSYTISLWVWIWRPRFHSEADKVVFSSKHIYPRISPHTPLLPAILYNVGVHADKFFFSAAQGRQNDHLGFHRGSVRYHEWVHLAMTIENNLLVAYQDGERLDQLQYGAMDILPGPVNTCVYDVNTHMEAYNAHSKRTKKSLLKQSTGGAFYDTIVTDRWAAHANNTVLGIASDAHSAEHSTIGMMHQFVVVRNQALSAQQIRLLREQTQPPPQKTLKSLLRTYQIASLEGICPMGFAGDFYRMLSWGLCPDVVCGKICIDENVYLINNYHTAMATQRTVAIPQLVDLTVRLGLHKGNDSDVAVSTYTPPRRPLTKLPDIGYPSSAAAASTHHIGDGGVFDLQYGTAMDYLFPLLMPLNTLLWLFEDLLQYAVNLVLQVNHVHDHILNPFGLDGAFHGDATGGSSAVDSDADDQNASQYEHWLKNHQKADWYARSREGKVQGLYKAAVAWMNDRHDDSSGAGPQHAVDSKSTGAFMEAATADETATDVEMIATSAVSVTGDTQSIFATSKSSSADVNRNFNEWRTESAERAQAALMLAMWMATDVSDQGDPLDQPWAFQTTPLLAQPLRIALGYQTGFDAIQEDYVPMSEIQALLVLPASPVLGSVLKETHLIESLLQPGAQSTELAAEYFETTADPAPGEFYIDDSEPSVEEPAETPEPEVVLHEEVGDAGASRNVRQDYRFTIDENGEVVIVHEPKSDRASKAEAAHQERPVTAVPANTAKAPTPPVLQHFTQQQKKSAATDTPQVSQPESQKTNGSAPHWLSIFAEVNTDTIKAALHKDLKPLVAQGLTSTYVHSVIIERQMRKDHERVEERSRQARAQHGLAEQQTFLGAADDLLQASARRAAVDVQLKEFVHSLRGARRLADSTTSSNTGALTTTPKPGTSGTAGSVLTDTECSVAAAYYFPVTQYVAAQYGSVHSGTGILEEVRLIVSGGKPDGQAGEDDILHQHTEAEAYDGNAHAQTWLAKKYYWGFGGVEQNEQLARHWFEQAAAQNDPEGLYNVGIFHNNGQAGVPQNAELALQYFQRAADHPDNPFPMAMHAVGNIYLHDAQKKNVSRAMEYFLKAAAHRSDDAHFSLAMLYREGLGCPKDIPRSVAHLAVAASWGHVRALNFLAHALYDSDSWLAQYGREQHEVRRKHAMLSVLTSTAESGISSGSAGSDKTNKPATTSSTPQNSADDKSSASGVGTAGTKAGTAGGAGAPTSTSASSSAPANGTDTNTTDHAAARRNYTDSLLKSSLVFNEFELIKIYMADGSIVPLPYPLGNQEGSCQAALPLLKHLAEMSYRPKDLTRRALKEYLRGDFWSALRHYEEAADLGVYAAQENAAYLIEKMLPTECAQYEDYVLATHSAQDGTSSAVSVDGSRGSIETAAAGGKYKCTTAEECCKQYLSKLATRRWAQLAQAGEPRAMRKIADALLDPTQPYMLAEHPTSPSLSAGEASITAVTVAADNGTSPALTARQQAALLYALAGEQGDSESLLHLGWMLYYGQGVERNQTTANALFNAAMKIEAGEDLIAAEEAALAAEDAAYGDGQYTDAFDATAVDEHGVNAEALQEASLSRHEHARRWHIAGYASKTTGGAAPALALAVVRADAMLRYFGFNTTVQELHLQAEVLANAYVPTVVKDWWNADPRKAKNQSTGVWGFFSNISRQLRATHRWIRQVEEQDSELYNALWETALLIVVIIVTRFVLRAFNPQA